MKQAGGGPEAGPGAEPGTGAGTTKDRYRGDFPIIAPAVTPDVDFRDLPARLRDHAARHPSAPALSAEGVVLDWAALVARIGGAAGWLAAQGVEPGDCVASLARNSAAHLILYLGVLARGAAMAPLPAMAHPRALARMLDNCGARIVLADDEGMEALAAALPETGAAGGAARDDERHDRSGAACGAESGTAARPGDRAEPRTPHGRGHDQASASGTISATISATARASGSGHASDRASGGALPRLVALSDFDAAIPTHPPAPPVAIAPGALFDIIYSSGTTGDPKGIEHDHLFRDRQLRRMAAYGFGPDAVTLVSTPLYSNTTWAALLPALAHGGHVVMMRKFDPGQFLQLAEGRRATHAMLVPVQYRRLLEEAAFDRYDLSAFRAKFSTSAPFPVPLLREVLARWPGRMINIYGMTEGGISAILDCGAHPDKLHSVGRASAGAEIVILGPAGQVLPPGATGEIAGHAPSIMRGYRAAPEQTRAALWQAPDGRSFIRTGDMGRLDEDGFLILLDRRRDMIISGGFNIFAADLEAVLAEHPSVAEVAVIGVPSARWGETPLALVVPRPGHAGRPDARPAALCEWANARLGRLQRIAAVELRDALPRSDIGKVLKRILRAPYWDGREPDAAAPADAAPADAAPADAAAPGSAVTGSAVTGSAGGADRGRGADGGRRAAGRDGEGRAHEDGGGGTPAARGDPA